MGLRHGAAENGDSGDEDYSGRGRFNGAAAWSRRKRFRDTSMLTTTPGASMGLRHGAAENRRNATPTRRTRCGFNGAAAWSRRKPAPRHCPSSPASPASMGLRHGAAENDVLCEWPMDGRMLQWGCGMEPQKTQRHFVFGCDQSAASMGLRHGAAENLPRGSSPPFRGGASMGLRHGAAENSASVIGKSVPAIASMGLRHGAAENLLRTVAWPQDEKRFNGAAAWSRRKRFREVFAL